MSAAGSSPAAEASRPGSPRRSGSEAPGVCASFCLSAYGNTASDRNPSRIMASIYYNLREKRFACCGGRVGAVGSTAGSGSGGKTLSIMTLPTVGCRQHNCHRFANIIKCRFGNYSPHVGPRCAIWAALGNSHPGAAPAH
jgi:hypothetical protein